MGQPLYESKQLSMSIEDRLLKAYTDIFTKKPVDKRNQEEFSRRLLYNTGVDLCYNGLRVSGKTPPLLDHAIQDYFAHPLVSYQINLNKTASGTLEKTIAFILNQKEKILKENFQAHSAVHKHIDIGVQSLIDVMEDAELLSVEDAKKFRDSYKAKSEVSYNKLYQVLEMRRKGLTSTRRNYVKRHR